MRVWVLLSCVVVLGMLATAGYAYEPLDEAAAAGTVGSQASCYAKGEKACPRAETRECSLGQCEGVDRCISHKINTVAYCASVAEGGTGKTGCDKTYDPKIACYEVQYYAYDPNLGCDGRCDGQILRMDAMDVNWASDVALTAEVCDVPVPEPEEPGGEEPEPVG